MIHSTNVLINTSLFQVAHAVVVADPALPDTPIQKETPDPSNESPASPKQVTLHGSQTLYQTLFLNTLLYKCMTMYYTVLFLIHNTILKLFSLL